MRSPDRGFLAALVALARAHVEFILVGVGGINFYAVDASQSVETQDLDALLAPRIEALRNALVALAGAGFSFQTGREPFLDIDDESILGKTSGLGLRLRRSGRGRRYVPHRGRRGAGRSARKAPSREGARWPPQGLEFLSLYAARLRELAGKP